MQYYKLRKTFVVTVCPDFPPNWNEGAGMSQTNSKPFKKRNRTNKFKVIVINQHKRNQKLSYNR